MGKTPSFVPDEFFIGEKEWLEAQSFGSLDEVNGSRSRCGIHESALQATRDLRKRGP